MAECRPALTPGEADGGVDLPCEGKPEELNPDDVRRVQKLAGSLIWLSTRTRPDISYAQSRISSMSTKAPTRALEEGLRVLRYLQGTKDIGLHYKACQGHEKVTAYGGVQTSG